MAPSMRTIRARVPPNQSAMRFLLRLAASSLANTWRGWVGGGGEPESPKASRACRFRRGEAAWMHAHSYHVVSALREVQAGAAWRIRASLHGYNGLLKCGTSRCMRCPPGSSCTCKNAWVTSSNIGAARRAVQPPARGRRRGLWAPSAKLRYPALLQPSVYHLSTAAHLYFGLPPPGAAGGRGWHQTRQSAAAQTAWRPGPECPWCWTESRR